MRQSGLSTPCSSGPSWRAGAAALAAGLLALGGARSASADELVLRPYASLSEQYNDNVNFSQDPTGDWITSIAVGMGLAYSGPRLHAWFAGGNTSQFYLQQAEDNDPAGSQYGLLSLSYAATPRLQLTVTDGVNRVGRGRVPGPPIASGGGPDVPPPTDPGDEAGLLLPGGSALSNVASVGATYRITPLLSGSALYSNTINDFTNPDTSDMTNAATAGLAYLWQPDWTVSGSYSFQRLDFTEQPDTITNTVSAGVGVQLDPLWATGGSLGVFVNQEVGGSDSNLPQRVGPTFSLYLDGAFESWSLATGASQGVTTSGGVGGVSITRNFYLGGRYQVLRNLDVYGNLIYSHFDTDPTSYDQAQAIVGLSYPINRYLAAGLTYYFIYNHNDITTATLAAGDIYSNSVLLSLSAGFDLWRDTTGSVFGW